MFEIGKFIEGTLDEHRKTKTWLAEQININYKTLVGKLNRNSITAEELIIIGEILHIDLNTLKKYYKHEEEQTMNEIFVLSLERLYETIVEDKRIMTNEDYCKWEDKIKNDKRFKVKGNSALFTTENVEGIKEDYKTLLDGYDVVFLEIVSLESDFMEFGDIVAEQKRQLISEYLEEYGWDNVRKTLLGYLKGIGVKHIFEG